MRRRIRDGLEPPIGSWSATRPRWQDLAFTSPQTHSVKLRIWVILIPGTPNTREDLTKMALESIIRRGDGQHGNLLIGFVPCLTEYLEGGLDC